MNVLPARDLQKGTRLGKYEVQEMIGRGGMGAVYRAWDAALHRNIAIKTLAPVDEIAGGSDLLTARFEREALAVGKVRHQNIVQVYDAGISEDGTRFLVMEYLEGKTFGDTLKSRRDGLTVAEAVEIMLGVCAGVSACHRQGIIHRDLKPANVFLAKTDFQDDTYEVKVLDFGVSKAVKEEELTHEGQIIGTPNYMSPEQARGKGDADIDARSDQYAIGVLLYAATARRLPYQDLKGLDLMQAISRGEFRPPREFRPEIPRGLEAVILRAMNVDPDARFASVHELGRALLPFSGDRAKQKWTWMFSSAPHPAEVSAPRSESPLPESAAGIAVLAGAPSGVLTLSDRPNGDRATEAVSYTKTTVIASAPTPAVAMRETGPQASPPDAKPKVDPTEETPPAEPPREALTSTKVQAAPLPAAAGENPEPAAEAAAAPPEATAAASVPPAVGNKKRSLRVPLAVAAVVLVGGGIALAVARGQSEEPLGVRNLPPGSPVLTARAPAPATPAAPAPADATPAPAVTAAASSPPPAPVAPANPAATAPPGRKHAGERAMEGRRRREPKVEYGPNGVPIPP